MSKNKLDSLKVSNEVYQAAVAKLANKLENRAFSRVTLDGCEAEWLRNFMEQFRGEWDDNYCDLCHKPYPPENLEDDDPNGEYCEGRH